jgi:hypothetical protein
VVTVVQELNYETHLLAYLRDTENKKQTAVRYDSATVRARALRLSFISLISLSTSSINLVAADERTM